MTLCIFLAIIGLATRCMLPLLARRVCFWDADATQNSLLLSPVSLPAAPYQSISIIQWKSYHSLYGEISVHASGG